MKDDRFKFSDFDEVFGELLEVHRVKRSKFEVFAIPAIILVPLIGGVIAYSETRDICVIPVCIVPFTLIFGGLVWHYFSTRHDELRIYENGFTYKSRKKLQSCLWDDIKTYRHRERKDYESAETAENFAPLGVVEKTNGEEINFDDDLTGTQEIIVRYQSRKTKKKIAARK